MSIYRYAMAGSRINYDPRPVSPPEWEEPDPPEDDAAGALCAPFDDDPPEWMIDNGPQWDAGRLY